MNKTWENCDKPNFRLDFGSFGTLNFLWILCLLVVRHCSKPSSYAIERKANEPKGKLMSQTETNVKNLISGLLLAQI